MSSPSPLGGMCVPEDWDDREKLLEYLSLQLIAKRVSLFLGAGISEPFKLPDWKALVNTMFAKARKPRPPGLPDTAAAEWLLTNHYRDRLSFASAVQESLYSAGTVSNAHLETSPLLSAIGALVMSSVRGNAANVVTFNYDDLLESYLSWRGFAVEAIDVLPRWTSLADVSVLHPHGLLRSDMSRPNRGVVLTQLDYDEIVGDSKDLWRQRLTSIMRSTTPIFIGLSGDDDNLTNMMNEVSKLHSKGPSVLYWGVRLGLADDPKASKWTARGVFHHPLDKHDDVAPFIMEICRRSAKHRTGLH